MWPAGSLKRIVSRGDAEENFGQDYRIGGIESGPWEVLMAEMRQYEYDIGPTGQVSYVAPSGYHNDCVMALALAVWGCRTFDVESEG